MAEVCEPDRAPAPCGGPRVLIVRPSALGDVTRSVPALVTIRQALPDSRIDWLVQDDYADAVRHHPALDGLVLFPRARFRGAWRRPDAWGELRRWLRDLRARRYDVAFDLQGLARSGSFTWFTRAPERVGFADARELGWLGCNRRYRVDDRLHSVDRMLALLAAHGLTPCRDLTLHVGPDDARWLAAWRAEHLGVARPYACIAPTARWLSKCWPIERYAQVARRMLDCRPELALVVLASPGERGQVELLLRDLASEARGDRPRVLLPATTVGQMMALIGQAGLLVCNDSAPMHVAAGLARPLVAIFGPTDPARVGPYGLPHAVVRPDGLSGPMTSYRRQDDQSLIARVSVEQVWEKVQREMGVTRSG